MDTLKFSLIIILFFFLNSCQKDPCETIICKNGGTCSNGICNCATGYTGSDCGNEKDPISVTISKIVVTQYPMTDGSGAGWDINAGPDIFLSINLGSSVNKNTFTTGTISDVNGGSLTFQNSFPWAMSTPSSTWSIGLWDYDSPDPDDYMDGVSFIPTNYKKDFPTTIELSTSSVKMTLFVSWNF